MCKALFALSDHAAATHRPQIINIGGETGAIACSVAAEDEAAQEAFCDTIVPRPLLMEFKHAFPWQVNDCLAGRGVLPRLQTVDLETGLVRKGRINQLDAKLRNGVGLRVTFTPDAEQPSSGDSRFRDYDGAWRLVLTPS